MPLQCLRLPLYLIEFVVLCLSRKISMFLLTRRFTTAVKAVLPMSCAWSVELVVW